MNNLIGNLTHGSLFTGIGGFDLGAEMSGIKTLWGCEIEEFNVKIIKKHFPETRIYKDIVTMQTPEYVDIISGGFPCQDISISNISKENFIDGKAKGINGKRSGLWTEMWRIIRDVRPRYVIIENSPMLTVRGLGKVLHDLTKIGYVCEWQSLSATQFGYNHKRTRFYGIAYPYEKRCTNNTSIFIELPKVLLKKLSRQNPLSVPIKRFNGKSSYEFLRMDDGFSKELDKRRISSLGNAVIPEIAHYLFECIKKFEFKKRESILQ